ncbi:uncharacterized protein GGS25DRAFT_402677 [Hypoxylon fragiforme]|uniref:uncharacterized protein n=1 Tax=Hypoxylon fragiforme TaxID=63214 RepID=UPI0020C72B85|nr:uncharacterized protein GGS25DRAFT_402677 [Hypoxylon fragiforme]KAI2604887.1 hypothetical protein GGS25DRAFT_402677 [Hypoxylon fragiforme]
MANFTCGHDLPKSRIGVNLAYVPRDSTNRCPDCQIKTPSGIIALLKNLQKPRDIVRTSLIKSPTPKSPLARTSSSSIMRSPLSRSSSTASLSATTTTIRAMDTASINQHVMTFAFDAFAQKRKAAAMGFKERYEEMLDAWGETAYRLLDRRQISSFAMTARGRWGSDVTRQALRAVATASLKLNGVYAPIEPETAELLTTINRMISLMRQRAAAVETCEQLYIIFQGAETLRVLRVDVNIALAQLEEGLTRWEAAAAGK